MFRFITLIICLLCTQGCGPPPPGPETKATLAAINALRQNQMPQLMTLVTPETKSAWAKALDLGDAASDQDIAERLVTDFGWQYQIPRRPWPKVVEGKDHESVRVVQVYLGRELVRFPVHKIEGEWRVDLLNAQVVAEEDAEQ